MERRARIWSTAFAIEVERCDSDDLISAMTALRAIFDAVQLVAEDHEEFSQEKHVELIDELALAGRLLRLQVADRILDADGLGRLCAGGFGRPFHLRVTPNFQGPIWHRTGSANGSRVFVVVINDALTQASGVLGGAVAMV